MIPINAKIVEFCPDAGGPCLGDKCAAFRDILIVNMDGGQTFIANTIGKDVVVEPLTFTLQVNCCQRHQMFADKGSLNLFLDFNDLFKVQEQVEKSTNVSGGK